MEEKIIKGIIDKPIDRTEPIRTLVEKAGGKLIVSRCRFLNDRRNGASSRPRWPTSTVYWRGSF
jgi:hypothetical protein